MGASTFEGMSAALRDRQVRIQDSIYDAFRVQAFHNRGASITGLVNDMLSSGLKLAEAGILNLPTEEIIRLVRAAQKMEAAA